MRVKKPSLVAAIIAVATFSAVIHSCLGGRILVFYPISSKSMTNVFRPFVEGLVNHGHDVTVVTPVPTKITSPNLTELQPLTIDEIFTSYPDPFEIRRQASLFKFPVEFLQRNCHKLYQNKEFRKLEGERFDVIVMNFLYHDCFAGMLYKMKSPIIFFGTLPISEGWTRMMGNWMPSSFIPIVTLGDISAQLSFLQRTKNFLYNIHFSIMFEVWTKPPLERIYKEYLGEDLPSINDIYKERVTVFMMNAHFSVTNPRPLLPSIVEIGGLHCNPAQRLPKDIEEFVSGAEEGFIVFSLGSIVRASEMPESVRRAFATAFGKLKQRVVWKWEKDGGMEDLPANVKLVKWLPQQDLLGHPKIRLFITHGGLLSTEEAVYHGVPVLGMPIFLDQDSNMRQAEILGFGVKGEILDLTETQLLSWIRKIVDDPKYMKKAKEISGIFRDNPESPVERAMYWTEYVIRHKGAFHLRSAGMHLNEIQYHSVDVISFLLLVAIIFVLVIYHIFKIIVKIITKVFLSKRMDSSLARKKNF